MKKPSRFATDVKKLKQSLSPSPGKLVDITGNIAMLSRPHQASGISSSEKLHLRLPFLQFTSTTDPLELALDHPSVDPFRPKTPPRSPPSRPSK